MATAEERPLDDRLGTGEPRWKVSIAYVDRDGKVTSDIAEIPARNLEAPAFSRTPDLAVEMEAGRLARLVMRARNRG